MTFVFGGAGCGPSFDYDLIIENGNIYDGSGSDPYTADIAISGDKIVGIGVYDSASSRTRIDAKGLAVSPGFINMLSWAATSLIHDGRSQSDIRQGVTLEVFGEGTSLGPLTEQMRQHQMERQSDIKFDIDWLTLGQGLESLAKRGISSNIASFVGASTVRIHVIGFEDRAASAEELQRMKDLVTEAMEEGAMGVGSSLIYIPATFASTEELIELAKVAAAYDGMYISHLRSEGDQLLEAFDEFLRIARESGARSEIYHLKASGEKNWAKLDEVIRTIEAERANGLPVTADMYTYPASSTGLTVLLPNWAKEGGHEKMMTRLKDVGLWRRLREEIDFGGAGSPERILLVGFRNESLRDLVGKTLAEVAELRRMDPREVIRELILEDDSRIGTIYFSMSEENLRKKIALPWVSFCSDAGSISPEGVFLNRNPHPRTYGSFARVLGKFCRDEQLISLKEAIHRLSGFPAANLKLKDRGLLKTGYYADIAIFDPAQVQDHSTFEDPHHFSTGMQHVIVNGVPVLKDGEHTDARPGRVVRGPGWKN